MKLLKYVICALFIGGLMGCPSNDDNSSSSCINEDNLARESACFAATVIDNGNLFPNPVQVGSTVNLNMKIAAVDSNLNPITATISTKVFSINGQFVTQQNINTVQSDSNYQNVPVWTNVNVAAGAYFLEVTVDVGPCGSKTICLSKNRLIVLE